MKIYKIILLFICSLTFAQSPALIDQFQYGATLKAKIDFIPCSNNENKINFRLSSSFGIASKWLTNEVYPSLNAELHLYNGGLGSKSLPDDRYLTFDAIVAFTITAGNVHDSFYSNKLSPYRNLPLYYFSDFTVPALQNPYNYSLSLGTNLVFTTDKERSNQRLGFLNFNHSRTQLSYYNDGTPFQYILLGDGRDRYYTGGAVISYNSGFASLDDINSYSFQVSYHKFTGFNQNSFEIANIINASNVDYKETSQVKYNKSLWRSTITSSNHYQGYGFTFSRYNSVKLDAQHFIHWIIDNSFHIVPYKPYNSFEPNYYLISTSFKN